MRAVMPTPAKLAERLGARVAGEIPGAGGLPSAPRPRSSHQALCELSWSVGKSSTRALRPTSQLSISKKRVYFSSCLEKNRVARIQLLWPRYVPRIRQPVTAPVALRHVLAGQMPRSISGFHGSISLRHRKRLPYFLLPGRWPTQFTNKSQQVLHSLGSNLSNVALITDTES